MANSFTSIAPHYEDLMDGVPYAMWVSYLKLVWAKLGVSPKSVLEVCCGTGKLCRLLQAEGYQMTGVDLSREMIREAKRLAAAIGANDITFYAQDAAQLRLNERFDAAFSFFDSLNYITDPAQCEQAIAKTSEHLYSGAPFLFDLNTEFAFEENMFDQQDMRSKTLVKHKWVSAYDKAARLCRVEMKFWADGKEFEETHLQRAHSPEEILEWMTAAGFVDVEFFDAYTLNRPRGRSDRIHVLGVKA